jgi:hypothetical protein
VVRQGKGGGHMHMPPVVCQETPTLSLGIDFDLNQGSKSANNLPNSKLITEVWKIIDIKSITE